MLGLKRNPFIPNGLYDDPETFVGRREQLRLLFKGIDLFLSGFSRGDTVITGRTGMGKTILLRKIKQVLESRGTAAAYMTLLACRTPRSLWREIASELMASAARAGFSDLILLEEAVSAVDSARSTTLAFLKVREMVELLGKAVLLLDDCETLPKPKILSEVMRLTAIPQVMLVVSGRPPFWEEIKRKAPHLARRFPLDIDLPPMTDSEMLEMIELKLKAARERPASGLRPFTQKAVEEVVEFSDGIPGTAMKVLHLSVVIALERSARSIGTEIVREAIATVRREVKQRKRLHLTPRERQVLEALEELGEATSGEIAEKIGLNKSQASRILRALYESGLVKKVKRVTRGWKYAPD